jgi:glycosyltransferase involved in cell wall biosynthesis
MKKYYCFFPVRDGIEHIDDVMKSLVNQSLKPGKIVVVNDGSTDGTGKVLALYKKQYPDLVEVIHTDNKTRDYKRLPELWNKSLKDGYEYHMIGAGDVSFEHDYAKKILEKMDEDKDVVVASGDYEPFTSQSPHGAGRFVRQTFFDKIYEDGKYPLTIGYESETLVRVLMESKKAKIYNDVVFNHLDELGHGHNFSEFGWSMRALGYHPLWSLSRCLVDIKRLGLKGSFGMFKSYITYKPQPTGYYSQFSPEIRNFMRNYQSVTFRLVVFNWIVNALFFRKNMPDKLRNKLRRMARNYKRKSLAKVGITINED